MKSQDLCSLVFLCCLLAASSAGCDKLRGAGAEAREQGAGSGRGAQGDRPVTVSVAKAERRDVPIDLEGIGSVVAYKTVTIRAQVDGRLEKVLFKEGDTVKRGQPLAQLDPRPFQIQLRQAQSALERDRAQSNAASLNLERYKKLAEQKFTAQQMTDDQRALVGQYAGAVMADEAQIAAAQLNLSYARIVSPIDGVTGVRLIDPGNFLRASDTTGIVVVTQLDPIAVLFTLPQDDLPQVMAQMHSGKPLTADAYDRGGSVQLATGELLLIDNQINQTTATIRLKAAFPNPERRLWPNQFVKVRLHVSVEKNVLVVPTSALARGPMGTFVYVVTPQNTAAARPVELGVSLSDVSIIKRGLEVSELVVVDGQSQLRDGAKLHVEGAGKGERAIAGKEARAQRAADAGTRP
jgi:multidrug efflux system membrane fusion protein